MTPVCEWCGYHQNHDTLPCAKKEIDRLRSDAADLLEACNAVCVDLGFAEWGSPEHAEKVLRDIIEGNYEKLRAAIAKAEK